MAAKRPRDPAKEQLRDAIISNPRRKPARTAYTPPDTNGKLWALYGLGLMRLSDGAHNIGTALIWHANAKTGRCDPGIERLMHETGLSRRTIFRAIGELQDAGVLLHQRRAQQTSAYHLQWTKLVSAFSAFEARAKELTEQRQQSATDKHVRGVNLDTSEVSTLAPLEVSTLAPKPRKGKHRKENTCRESDTRSARPQPEPTSASPFRQEEPAAPSGSAAKDLGQEGRPPAGELSFSSNAKRSGPRQDCSAQSHVMRRMTGRPHPGPHPGMAAAGAGLLREMGNLFRRAQPSWEEELEDEEVRRWA